jgi:hypothetical protein
MSYQIYTDGIFGGIRESDEEPNGDDVFKTFAPAKRELVRRMQFRADEYRTAAREFRRYTLKDVERGRS